MKLEIAVVCWDKNNNWIHDVMRRSPCLSEADLRKITDEPQFQSYPILAFIAPMNCSDQLLKILASEAYAEMIQNKNNGE